MDRTAFRNAIRPLSPQEKRIKSGRSRDDVFFTLLEKKGLRLPDGCYHIPVNIRSLPEIRSLSDGALRDTLAGSPLQNRLRVFICQRYSVSRFHFNDCITIAYVYSGKMTVCFQDSRTTLRKGQLCLIGEQTVFRLGVLGEDDLVLVLQIDQNFLDSDFLRGLSVESTVADLVISSVFGTRHRFTCSVFDCNKVDKMQLLFEDIFCEYISPDICSAAIVENFLKLFFILLIRDSSTIRRPNVRTSIVKILKFIDEHYIDCTLEKISAAFGYNPQYVSRMIRERTGKSFSEVLTDVKMNKIRLFLLYSDIPVQDAVLKNGYTNMTFFYRKFREIYGMTPKEYRSRYAAAPAGEAPVKNFLSFRPDQPSS